MQRRLTDAEREMISNFLKLHMAIADCGLEVSPLLATKMLEHNTTDGLPYVEPELTDEDARARPWVMVRDGEDQAWKGPHRFAAKCVDKYYPYYVFSEDKTSAVEFNYCRRATPEEIASAGLETPDA
jgi:hypothetical protein